MALATGALVAMFAVMIVAMVLLMLIMGAVWATRYKKCPPDQAMVIFGKGNKPRQKKSFFVITSGGYFVWPVVQSVEYLNIGARTHEFRMRNMTTSKKGSGKNLDLIVTTTVHTPSDDQKLLETAAESILHKSEDETEEMVRMIIDGSMRGVCRGIKAKDLQDDPDAAAKKFRKTANEELNGIGIAIKTFALKEVLEKV